jgi:pseudouridine synthase
VIDNTTERLQKAIAKRGIASRRKAEEYITSGRVRVNGKVVTELGVKVSELDRIDVDGAAIGDTQSFVYILFYKPIRVMSTSSDPQGRKTVHDFLTDIDTRVYSVGRLDYETSGLLILTNDGKLTHRLMHPGFGVEKSYEVLVAGEVSQQAIISLRKGILLDGRMTSPAYVRILGKDATSTKLEITIHEGRNRQVRNMMDFVGYPCLKLTRVRYGPLNLRGMRPGEWRYLTEIEVDKLSSLTMAQKRNGRLSK